MFDLSSRRLLSESVQRANCVPQGFPYTGLLPLRDQSISRSLPQRPCRSTHEHEDSTRLRRTEFVIPVLANTKQAAGLSCLGQHKQLTVMALSRGPDWSQDPQSTNSRNLSWLQTVYGFMISFHQPTGTFQVCTDTTVIFIALL